MHMSKILPPLLVIKPGNPWQISLLPDTAVDKSFPL